MKLTFFRTSDAIGTHEFTGFVMMPTKAFGQFREMAAAMSRTTPAFVLNRSSRLMPGLRGTPAGMITTWASMVKNYSYHRTLFSYLKTSGKF